MYRSIVILFLVLSSWAHGSENTDYNCISTATNDICIKIPKSQDAKPLDAFEYGYWDAVFSYSGAALLDGAISQSKSLGEDIAIKALGLVAQELGAPSFVLGLLGITGGGDPGMSNEQVVAEVDRLLKEQTNVILSYIDANRVELIQDIKVILANNCTIQTSDEYDAIQERILRWNNYEPILKSTTQHLGDVLQALSDLSEIRHVYSTNDETNNYCFYSKHVEFFSWYMHLYALEIATRISYHNVANEDPTLKKLNVESDLLLTRNSLDQTIKGFEVFQSDHHLAADEVASGDKRNVWWDDVVNDTTDPIKAVSNYPEGFYNECTASGLPTENTIIRDRLKEKNALANVFNQSNTVKKCDFTSYTIGEYTYTIDMYVMSSSGLSGVSFSSIMVASHFSESDPFYMTEAHAGIGLGLNPNDDSFSYEHQWFHDPDLYSDFISKIFQHHMNLEYTQRLQMAYAPYQEFLDGIWEYTLDTTGVVRPQNKMDRELLRTSGLFSLDNDGLDIITEQQIGTNPRSEDTDLDGHNDGYEYITAGLDPLVPNNSNIDSDGDGITNYQELIDGTDPYTYDDFTNGCSLEAYKNGDPYGVVIVKVIASWPYGHAEMHFDDSVPSFVPHGGSFYYPEGEQSVYNEFRCENGDLINRIQHIGERTIPYCYDASFRKAYPLEKGQCGEWGK